MFGTQEYGGCLWLDTSSTTKGYYDRYKNDLLEVDSGRSALQYIVETYQYKRIWLPIYNCPLVYERLRKVSNIEVIFYNLNEDFSPSIGNISLGKGDAFLWINYCGVMEPQLIDRIVRMQEELAVDIIIDNIPAFFCEPRMRVFNIYSCRKFIGVADGGYLIKTGLKKENLPVYNTAQNYLYLLKAIENGSDSVYEEYQKSEKRITEKAEAFGMPILTRRILSGIDYDSIREKRFENFCELHKNLGQKNRMKMSVASKTPSVYPYLTSDKKLREKLLEKKVFVSRFWKHVLMNINSNSFERDLAEYLLPLPIDQRYGIQDMKRIAEIVISLEN